MRKTPNSHPAEGSGHLPTGPNEAYAAFGSKAQELSQKHQDRKRLFEQLRKDSLAVRDESMRVLQEFEQLDS